MTSAEVFRFFFYHMNWPQVSQFSQLKPRRFFHGHVCPNSTPWRLTRMIRRRCRVREKLLWLSCSGWFFLLGNHGVSGWTSWKRRVFNCETSVQAVDWAMNHQETTGKPTFFDHEWGNQELIFFHDIWTWAAYSKIGPNNGLHIQEGRFSLIRRGFLSRIYYWWWFSQI